MVDVCRSVIGGLDAAQSVNCVSRSSKDSGTAIHSFCNEKSFQSLKVDKMQLKIA